MGTTIRREPVSFAIPKAPDYKFLNITNFGGIEKSSNPFVVSANTASDCLNVYVDEDNALTTRPRVSPKYDLLKLAGLPNDFNVIAVYNLHDGYLLNGYRVNGSPTWIKFTYNRNKTSLKVGDIVTYHTATKPHCVFEQDGKIYIIGHGRYLTFDGTTMSEVEPYVPTTRVGKNKIIKTLKDDSSNPLQYEVDVEGSSYEPMNVLTNKYKETYFWDGRSNYMNTPNTTTISIKNDYFKNTGDVMAPKNTLILGVFANNSNLTEKIFSIGVRSLAGYSITTIDSLGQIGPAEQMFPGSSELLGAVFSVNGNALCGYYKNSEGKFNVKTILKDSSSSTGFVEILCAKNYTKLPIILGVSDDGSRVVVRDKDALVSGSWYNILYNTKDAPLEYVSKLLRSEIPTMTNIEKKWFVSDDCTCVALFSDYSVEYCNLTTANDGDFVAREVFKLDKNYTFFSFHNASFSPKKTHLVLSYDYRDVVTNVTRSVVTLVDLSDLTDFSWSMSSNIVKILWVDNNKAYLLNIHENNFKDGILRFGDTQPFIIDGLNINGDRYYEDNTSYIAKDDYVIVQKSIRTEDIESLQGLGITEVLLSSSHPLLTIEFETLSSENSEILPKFKQALITQRFDNNTWFASGNYTFHTEYNNPTYIPVSSYNTLGEDYEEITGMSVINDNILAAYKRNKIYIITPVTVGDRLTYSYTETKNVIGNDAVGAPILTILTEMPTIVSYDGIYALNQLENVQSGDRITTLISEAINPKWLKESKADIDKCITLNRLYWTYYILPHEKISGENKSYTKIYLLDNRSQQWYYWDLPLLCINAFVKDNKTHLVDDNGKIFTLETTDLEGANPSETEYYDLVDPKARTPKLLIPWHWHSQILSLNTMNYTKRLVDTTFIMTDTDTQDGYRLQYRLKAWRKSVSETENGSEITGNVHYVQSTTKRTAIPRFSFIQFKLDNYEDDLQNNKLRLVGLGLKYVLLEGLY